MEATARTTVLPFALLSAAEGDPEVGCRIRSDRFSAFYDAYETYLAVKNVTCNTLSLQSRFVADLQTALSFTVAQPFGLCDDAQSYDSYLWWIRAVVCIFPTR